MRKLLLSLVLVACAACNSTPWMDSETAPDGDGTVIKKAPYHLNPGQRVAWEKAEVKVNALKQDGEIRQAQSARVITAIESTETTPIKSVVQLHDFALGTTKARKALD